VRRRQILGLGETSIDSAISTELEFWSARVKPENIHGSRPNEAAAPDETERSQRKAEGKSAQDTEAE
jgi:hypothetical protein